VVADEPRLGQHGPGGGKRDHSETPEEGSSPVPRCRLRTDVWHHNLRAINVIVRSMNPQRKGTTKDTGTEDTGTGMMRTELV